MWAALCLIVPLLAGCGYPGDSKCSGWNAATADTKNDWVHADGYDTDADLRIEELNDLCKAVPGVTLSDLNDVHNFSELSDRLSELDSDGN
jgi:hypothetical protein